MRQRVVIDSSGARAEEAASISIKQRDIDYMLKWVVLPGQVNISDEEEMAERIPPRRRV